MVFGAGASNESFMHLHFIVPGLKIGIKEYLDILKTSLLPWMGQNFGLDNMVLIQDSWPSHISKAEEDSIFLRDIWPTNSLDLNFLDNFL